MSSTPAGPFVLLSTMAYHISVSGIGPALLQATFLAATIYIAAGLVRHWRRTQSLAPGPRRLPIFGNALQIPSKFLFLRIAEWAEQYGQSQRSKLHACIQSTNR